MKGLARILLEHPRLVALAVLAVTAAFGAVLARGLRVDNSIAAFLPAGDAELARYAEFRAVFGEDSYLVVALCGVDLDDSAQAASAARMQFDLQGLPGVARVLGPFAQDGAGTPRLRAGSDLASRLAAPEQGAVAFLVQPDADLGSAAKQLLFEGIDQLHASSGSNAALRVAGPEAINHHLDAASNRSFSRLFPAVVLLIGLVLWAALGRLSTALAVLLVAGAASVWTCGALVLSGRSFNMVVSIVPALLVVIGPAYALHLAAAHRAAAAPTNAERWRRAIDDTFRPCLMTAATTAAGFLALSCADLLPVRDLGLFAALGVALSFLLVFSLLPALDLLFSGRAASGGCAARSASRLPARAVAALRRVRWPILGGASLAAAVAGFGLSRLAVESDILSYFPADHPLVTATAAIEESITGLTPIEIWVSGARADLLSADMVEEGARLERIISAQPNVTGVFGPLLGERARDEEERMDVRWTVASRTTSIETSAALMALIEQEAGSRLPPAISARVTGAVPLLVRMQALLLRTQIRTFALSLAIVTLLLAFAFRSLRLALLALVPNLLPVLLTLGMMGFLGIPLNVATVMVASIAFGLVVDDTIHFLDRYARGGAAPAAARLEEVLRAVGRPIVFTSAATALGFAAFTAASFQPTFHFGLLIAATAVFALACDLLLLPALLLVRR
ncbi:MAG: MMPL family transporter [Planctomycetes bacterium]|nr:MMPL family transporter [Planctomycetota bacterium]